MFEQSKRTVRKIDPQELGGMQISEPCANRILMTLPTWNEVYDYDSKLLGMLIPSLSSLDVKLLKELARVKLEIPKEQDV